MDLRPILSDAYPIFINDSFIYTKNLNPGKITSNVYQRKNTTFSNLERQNKPKINITNLIKRKLKLFLKNNKDTINKSIQTRKKRNIFNEYLKVHQSPENTNLSGSRRYVNNNYFNLTKRKKAVKYLFPSKSNRKYSVFRTVQEKNDAKLDFLHKRNKREKKSRKGKHKKKPKQSGASMTVTTPFPVFDPTKYHWIPTMSPYIDDVQFWGKEPVDIIWPKRAKALPQTYRFILAYIVLDALWLGVTVLLVGKYNYKYFEQ